MNDLPLVFSGHRWPAARILDRKEILRRPEDSAALETVSVFTISASGNGRAWETEEPRGFWRTFAELDQNDEAAVIDIVRRYGDPDGQLLPEKPVHTGHWHGWATFLALISHAWRDPDHDGISHVRDDFVAQATADLIMPRLDVRLNVGSSLQPVARAMRLGDYMVASASFMVARRAPMRRCDHCRHWFALKRSTARFCSTECRSAVFRLDKGAAHHGIRA
ncbi:hypothetical protein [Mesorhizobium sp.]|uniref:hypothetical protein n=1 Tax=Mesorhizobium sp. TaxID=1871066 RepID=UPI000FE74AB5|nr:hypothetical protein [Mesorhizobium sp.]RWK11852.1 MAG: hypothetical protein EOR39_06970 [Mesorhizobium sp.]TIQ49053.1 MAG: hypothetical protein E5X47_14600 [Mesorhizobium sp.]TIQ58868.1 MAG: hypothetical protein E5X46_09805 [Mesorhizobium sp.]